MVQGADVAKFYSTLGTYFSYSSTSLFSTLSLPFNKKLKYLLEKSARIENYCVGFCQEIYHLKKGKNTQQS
jgi:hypothetical protein